MNVVRVGRNENKSQENGGMDLTEKIGIRVKREIIYEKTESTNPWGYPRERIFNREYKYVLYPHWTTEGLVEESISENLLKKGSVGYILRKGHI